MNQLPQKAAFSIRAARPGDEKIIFGLLAEFALFEKAAVFTLTEAAIVRDLLSPEAAARCDLMLVGDEVAGLTVWFSTYRSFRAARGVFVEDLYVKPQFRGGGLGRALLAHLARRAKAMDGFLEWLVLDWNAPAIAFYEGLGARPVAEWQSYRLESGALERLAA